jgi:hypothetical protein
MMHDFAHMKSDFFAFYGFSYGGMHIASRYANLKFIYIKQIEGQRQTETRSLERSQSRWGFYAENFIWTVVG